MEKVFFGIIKLKKNYFYVNSKLKTAHAFSVLQDVNNLPIVSNFLTLFFNRAFQKAFVKTDENINFNFIDNDCQEMQLFIQTMMKKLILSTVLKIK